MTHSELLIVTISCDLEDCPAEVSGKQVRYWDFMNVISKWGWRRTPSTSPHPVRPNVHGGSVSWGISLHFCPGHAELADHPERYTVADGKRACYVAKLVPVTVLEEAR